MKSYFILFILLTLFSINVNSQNAERKNNRFNENITVDIHGNLQYQNSSGLRASFSKNIFDDMVYSDNRGNETKYAANVWNEMRLDCDEYKMLYMLVDRASEMSNVKESYKRDIHGDFQYERNSFRASLSKTIFDEEVYRDSNGNEIKYSKEYWADIIRNFYDEVDVFFWVLDQCYDLRNYKEEYKIDIFGYQQYKNNRSESASLSTDIFGKKIYKDSNQNKIEYSDQAWNRLRKKYGSEKDIFVFLIQKYLRGVDGWRRNRDIRIPMQIGSISNIGIIDDPSITTISENILGTIISDGQSKHTEITKDAFGTTISDNKGNRTEITEDAFGTTIRDNKGNRTEITKDAFGTTIRDNKGNRTEITKDAFGTTIRDNKGNRTEITEDAFGTTIRDNKGNRATIKKDIFDTWIYSNNENQKAELKTDIFKKKIYTDSRNNKVEFSEESWQKLLDKINDEKKIFIYLVNQYLLR